MQKSNECVKKTEVEKLLGYTVSNSLFNEALEQAIKKRNYIYERNGQKSVLQPWHLHKLTEKYVQSLTLSKYTMELSRKLYNMEKERLIKRQDTPTTNFIVTSSAL